MHAWVEIDLDRLEHNFRILQKKAGKKTTLLPLVKAQAYGAGSEMTARTLVKAGAKMLSIVNVREACFLRDKGIKVPIMNVGDIEPCDYKDLVSYDIIQSVNHFPQLYSMAKWAEANRKKFHVHINIDTGMTRLGFRPEQLPELIDSLKKMPRLIVEGICSHLPCADEPDNPMTRKQKQQFLEIIKTFKENGIDPKWRHMENSTGMFLYKDRLFNIVRPGIALHGLEMPKRFGLKPVFSLKAKVTAIRNVPAGTGISYNCLYVTKKPTTIATISIGYSDGYSRRLTGRGSVLIKGKRFAIAGKVTMNFIMVDIGNNRGIKVGDDAVLIGNCGKEEIRMEDMASMLGTISYEVQCNISAQVPRVYFKGGKPVAVRQNILI